MDRGWPGHKGGLKEGGVDPTWTVRKSDRGTEYRMLMLSLESLVEQSLEGVPGKESARASAWSRAALGLGPRTQDPQEQVSPQGTWRVEENVKRSNKRQSLARS